MFSKTKVDSVKVFKVILIGDNQVGKTSILHSLLNKEFSLETISTLGYEYQEKQLKIDNNSIKLKLWDTAGQEKYQSLTVSFFKNAHGIYLVFDVTREESLDRASYWLNQLKEQLDEKKPIVLIGNKTDLVDQRIITEEQAKEFAKNNHIQYIGTSAKDKTNIEESFLLLTNLILKELPSNVSNLEGIALNNEKDEKKKKCCLSK